MPSRDEQTRRVGRHDVEVSSLSKVMFPESGITKGELVDYYQAIAPLMVPQIKDRPLSLRRWPAGIGKHGFFQKEAPEYYPDYVLRVPVEHGDGEVTDNAVANTPEALVYLANQNVVEFHIWGSRRDSIRKPDKFIMDFDPHAGADFEMVRDGALKCRDWLAEQGVKTQPMITGSRGIHVVGMLRRNRDYDAVADWTHKLADDLAEAYPDLLTTEFYKTKRGDRVFVDWLRNQYAQTAVAPYSVRAKEGAPVAAPVTWQEIESQQVLKGISKQALRADLFTIKDAPLLLERGDVWSQNAAKLAATATVK